MDCYRRELTGSEKKRLKNTGINGIIGKKLKQSITARLRGDLIAAFQYSKGAYKKDGDRLFSKACCDRTKGNGFKLKEGRFRYKEDIFYNEGGKTLEEVAQRGGRCPIPGNIQGQVGRGSEQPDPVSYTHLTLPTIYSV